MDTGPDTAAAEGGPSSSPTGDAVRDERVVRRDFWSKLRANVNRIPFIEDLLAAYYCATDAATPIRVKAVLFGALAYFILPVDAMPDFVAVLGFTDDAAVLAAAVQAVRSHLRPEHYRRARDAISAGAAS